MKLEILHTHELGNKILKYIILCINLNAFQKKTNEEWHSVAKYESMGTPEGENRFFCGNPMKQRSGTGGCFQK